MKAPKLVKLFKIGGEGLGGAAGIRANSVVDIEAIKKITDLPVIGIWKRHWVDEWWNIMITPTFADCKELADAVRKCAKDISSKYIAPPSTTQFAIMFLPVEGLYAEVVNMRGLVEDLQRTYKINVAGPSTMAAMLNSLRMGFQTLAVQKRSGEVWSVLADVKTEFAAFEKVLTDTQSRIRKAEEGLEALVGTRTRKINRTLSGIERLDAGNT